MSALPVRKRKLGAGSGSTAQSSKAAKHHAQGKPSDAVAHPYRGLAKEYLSRRNTDKKESKAEALLRKGMDYFKKGELDQADACFNVVRASWLGQQIHQELTITGFVAL